MYVFIDLLHLKGIWFIYFLIGSSVMWRGRGRVGGRNGGWGWRSSLKRLLCIRSPIHYTDDVLVVFSKFYRCL